MQTLLFIENYEIELDDSVQFALNKQFEELSNPTIIINDWSKTVSIPFTAQNNKIFGYLYKPDRLIIGTNNLNAYKSMGIYFDPTKKLDFRLVYNTMTLMSGYAKVNEIKQTKGKGTYEITLYGLLGKIFQELKKITFDKTSSDTDYIIDGSTYVYEEMNRTLVFKSWTTPGQYYITAYPRKLLTQGGEVDNPAYSVTDYIGFAPNNSFGEGFDYKTYQYSDSSTSTFIGTLEGESGESFKNATGISADTVIKNGMLPREIGEYRSYLQLPFIYFNKLFLIFQYKAEDITGYTFDLDRNWFSGGNPYYGNLVYMLKGLNYIKNPTYNNNYANSIYGPVSLTTLNDGSLPSKYDFSGRSNNLRFKVTTEQTEILNSDGTAFICDGTSVIDGQLTLTISMTVLNPLITSGEHITRIRNNSVINFDLYMNYNGSNSMIGRVCVKYSGSSYLASNSTYVVDKDDETLTSSNQDFDLLENMTFTFNIPSQVYNGNLSFYFKLSGWNDGGLNDTLFVERGGYSWSSINLGNIKTAVTSSATLSSQSLLGHSYSKVTLNDFWNNDFNLFDEIIKYCKMYKIMISVDDYNKTIKFRRFNEFFKDFEILDWTDKLDKSKDYRIKPLTFDKKYVLFNYNDLKTKLGEKYKEDYGVNYGEYKLATDYNFNTDTEKLFDKITPSIVNTDNVLSWTNINDYKKILYSFPSEIYVYNKDKDNKLVDIFGAYYFHKGLAYFSTESALHLRGVSISDDTTLQLDTNTYFYSLMGSVSTNVTSYPFLDIIYNNEMCVFNIPKSNYTYLTNYSGKHSIYENFWDSYINERYSIQNKLVTCYLQLKPSDWAQFSFNKFIKIENQLYIVNKIYDYNVTSSTTTKVDLVTVSDVDAYNDDFFMERMDVLTKNWSGIIYINGETGPSYRIGTFSSISPVHIKIGSSTILDEYTINGVKFTIVEGNKLYAQRVSRYIEEADKDFTLTFCNSRNETTAEFKRYSIYPYPQLSASKTSIGYNDTFNLYFDYTPTDDVAPTTTYTRTPSSSRNPTINIGTPTSSEIVYNGNLLTRWTIPVVCTSNSSSSTEIANFKVTDGVGGWYKKININISSLIYTLNSTGTARQDEDSVDYHGTSSTRNYLIYSSDPYEATTIPEGVRFYGGRSGNAGTSSMTIDWGSGEPNTSKTVIFTNTGGATCSLVCHYVIQSEIYTLNSAGTARQDEDSVDYHGTSSTRNYKIYSTHPYEATTVPQGVRFYGGNTGSEGTSGMTIDWGSGEPNTSKTVIFTNTGGATCSLVCHYVTQ